MSANFRTLTLAAAAMLGVAATGACADTGSSAAPTATPTPLSPADRQTADSVQRTVDAYGSAWAEPDEATRRAILDQAWTDGGIYTDPTVYAIGRDELVSHIGGFLASPAGDAPSGGLTATSRVELFRGALRFTWAVLAPDGTVLLEGMDFGTVAADGRLSRISGFFGALPPPVPSDVPENVAAIVAAANAGGEAARIAALEPVWSDASVYTTGAASVTGVAATAVAFAARAAAHPGEEIVLTSYVDKHHDTVRFTWAWVDSSGTSTNAGISYLEVAQDGRFTRLYEFAGAPPPLNEPS